MAAECEYFLEMREVFELTVERAVLVSDAAIGVAHTGRQNRALFVFAKLLGHSMTISMLVNQFDPCNENEPQFLDHATIAVVGRAVIDASIMSMYLSDPNITLNLWQLRRHILFYHDAITRKRFLTHLSEDSQNIDLDEYKFTKSTLQDKIKEFAVIEGFDDNTIIGLLKGKVFIEGVRGAVTEAGWDVKQFEWHQAYLSNWVHSYPVSFLRADEQQISFQKPSAYQIYLVTLVLEICSEYIDHVVVRMESFTGDISKDALGHIE